MGSGKRGKPRFLSMGKMIWLGIGLAALYWALDSAIHALIFHQGNLLGRILTLDPNVIWMRLLVVSILIIFGAYVQFIIAERKRTEEALRIKDSAIASSINAIAFADLEGNLTYINPSFLKLWGYDDEKEVLGRPAAQFWQTKENALVVMEGLRDRGSWIGELVAKRRDGSSFDVQLSASMVTDKVGKPICMMASFIDISERKRAEEGLKEYSERLEEMVEERATELKDAQEELIRKEHLAILGQLAGGVGHELRNPLGVISNAVYYLQTILPDADETTKEYLEMISSEVRNSEKIVSDLLDFSRTKPVAREEIAVSDLVAHLLEKQPPPEEVKVTTKITSDLPLLFVDPRQIGQVLLNLVTNAYQAMPQGGRLTVEAKGEKGKVYLSITDTGCGISQESMKRLFEPLFTTKARGIGLGLAVSKNLVEVNGGTIEVKSEEGKGSTFTVILPTKEVQARRRSCVSL